MARTFIRPLTQISPSASYADNLSPGSTLQSGAASIEADLNALRSQLNLSLTVQAGKWYDDLNVPSALDAGAKRSTNELNDDLHSLERKRVLIKDTLLAPVTVESVTGSPTPTPVEPATVPASEGTTHYVGSTRSFTTIQQAIDDPSVNNGDRLLLDAQTFTVSSTITVGKRLFIEGTFSIFGQSTVTTVGTSSAPEITFDVSSGGCVFKNLIIENNMPGGLSTAIKMFDTGGSSTFYLDSCTVTAGWTGLLIKQANFQVTNCSFVASNNAGIGRQAIWAKQAGATSPVTAPGTVIVSNCTYETKTDTIPAFAFFMRLGDGTFNDFGPVGGYIRLNNISVAGSGTLAQFLYMEAYTVASPIQLCITNCTQATSGHLVQVNIVDTGGTIGLERFEYIQLNSNSIQNFNGYGFVAFDGAPSGTPSLGACDIYASGNTATFTTLQGSRSTVVDSADPVEQLLVSYITIRYTLPALIPLGGAVVTSPSNYVILQAGELPTETTLALGAVTTIGTVAANNPSFGAHSMAEVAGANALAPKNLCEVVDAATRDPILSSGRVVYALMQSESGTDGTTISALTPNRVQLSFVRLNSAGNDLEAVPTADIGSKVINFAYVKRQALEDLNEETFLRGAEIDNAGSSLVNLQTAFDNQGATPVDLTASPTFDLGAGQLMRWRDDNQDPLLTVLSLTSMDGTTVGISDSVDFFDVNAVDVGMANGIKVASASLSTTLQIGKDDGKIQALSSDLKMSANSQLLVKDGNIVGSAWSNVDGMALAASSAEWDAFETAFGEVSLLNAIEQCLDQQNVRGTKTYYVVPSDVPPNTNIPTGVDMSAGDFVANYDVYLNGNLVQGGANSGVDNDFYPGADLSLGELKFEFDVKAGDVIAVVPYVAA